jgi:hypothetical protein
MLFMVVASVQAAVCFAHVLSSRDENEAIATAFAAVVIPVRVTSKGVDGAAKFTAAAATSAAQVLVELVGLNTTMMQVLLVPPWLKEGLVDQVPLNWHQNQVTVVSNPDASL